jgi:gliding motility-associated transport system ATP-binding protein
MIQVRDLQKRFDVTRAVDGVSFDMKRGEILGFLGPNGAGKTTTMRIITCFLQPTGGSVEVDGLDVTTHSLAVRERIGYLPESAPIYGDMNVVDYLMFVAEMRRVPSADRRRRVRHAIDACGLDEVIQKNAGQLSSGYRQRVGLAQAIVHDPPILVLDEPTRGLDPNQIVEIRQLIKDLGRQKTVIFSTHILSEVEAMCDRVLIISKGKKVFDGPKSDLRYGLTGGERVFVEMRANGDAAAALRKVNGVGAVRVVSEDGGLQRLHVEAPRGHDIREAIFDTAVQQGWKVLEMRRDTQSFEDVFRELTTTDA